MARSNRITEPIYPYGEWDITENGFKVENNVRNETIFSLGNGYIGMRGNFEEGYSGPPGTGLEGNYLNGFYESEVIKYPETAYGYAEKSQTMLNVTNGKVIRLHLDGEVFNLLTGEILEYERTLRLNAGILERRLVWRSPQGREVLIEVKRLVSFEHRHLAAIRYAVTPLNFSGTIQLIAALDGNVSNITTVADPRLGSILEGRALSVIDKTTEGTFGALLQQTKHTGFVLACAMENDLHVEGGSGYTAANTSDPFMVETVYNIDAIQGQPITLYKYIAYVTTQDYPQDELVIKAREVVTGAKAEGFEVLQSKQASFLADFWASADIVIKGDEALQQGLRFNMFQLLQSVGRDGKTNIAAKGLTGEGYEGHYFWDTEMYVVPFFLYNRPDISRKLLEYRYNTLDKARERARQMSHPKGALFPWRTINGEESSAYYPGGTAQYHINADIAYAIKRYVEVTGDEEFLIQCGAEILFETARLWADLGAYIPRKGNKFCINDVTGPDEYTALVDNNCYTNMMAQEHLWYAHQINSWMQSHAPDQYTELVAKIGLEPGEPIEWKKAADAMYIPYDDALQIYMQDDTFLDKEPWDFANTPPDKYPLLIHYHPLVLYRHQVCKQADLVLALFLLGHRFTQEEKRRNYDYYEKVTTHDSSLSTCTFSIVANEIDYHVKAYHYFMLTARMDLDDYHGNVKDGVHIANMAGTWMCLVNGFAGMRITDGALCLTPSLPAGWEEYSFKLRYQGCFLRVTVARDCTTYELLEGDDLEIHHNGKSLLLKAGQPVQMEQAKVA